MQPARTVLMKIQLFLGNMLHRYAGYAKKATKPRFDCRGNESIGSLKKKAYLVPYRVRVRVRARTRVILGLRFFLGLELPP